MIRLENVSKRYGTASALESVSLSAAPDEILVIAGPSGSGKTTLLRLIAGFERLTEGRIDIDGREASTPKRMAAPHERGLGFIFQDLALWPHLTACEHVRFMMEKRKLENRALKAEAEEILKAVQLEGFGHRYPHELSGGERQRLAIARSIAARPKYFLMDEPFSHLDAFLKEELTDFVRRIRNRFQMGIVYVTHQAVDALAFADRIAVLREGRLEQAGTAAEVLSRPSNEFVRRLLVPLDN